MLSAVMNEKLTPFTQMIDTVFTRFDHLSKEVMIDEVTLQLKETMDDEEVLATIIQTAVEKTSVEEPDWQFVASQFLTFQLYREAATNRNYKVDDKYGNLYTLLHKLTEQGLYGAYLLEHYTREDINELQAYISPERDLLFNYIGLKVLADRYLVRDFEAKVMELPQERFMVIAMHLAQNEKEKVRWAKQFYDVLSKLEMTVATPTLSNAGKPLHQLSSCFIDTVDDSLWSIYNTNTSTAQVSKHGGGVGIYLGKVRSKGSKIRGHKGASGGVIPWIRNYNNTAVAVDQLGVRRGAFAIYLDIWHNDILDFLNLKTNNGDDRLKAHDIFPGVCIPDLFMETVKERGTWYLFDPHEVREVMGYSIEDYWGEAFEKRYHECVAHPGIHKTEIAAIDIMKRIMVSAFETGTPFVFFRDTVNRANPNKHEGMIYSSNLCTEICQNMSPTQLLQEEIEDGVIVTKTKPGDFVVCNLSSINLGRIQSYEDIKRIVSTQVRMLDNVIDLNIYPVRQAEITNKKYRAIGLGTSGYHQYLAQNKIMWESEEHIIEADRLYEEIAYHTIRASMQIAKEKGSYKVFEGSEWQTGAYFESRGYTSERWNELQMDVAQNGMRNAWVFAVAPTGSTSLIAGSTAGIDPVYAKYFVEEKRSAVIPQTAPNLNQETTWYYKEAHLIDQSYSIRAGGRRQHHIDQAQSLNLYITPETSAREFLDLYIESWENGLKTLYYVRNQSVDVEDCASCSS
ncbi:ribonucleoside-diphosphate reductase subunit alpha [Hazenella sp. IB182353]|uniref:ribonucleoside-diphosphate reductase subunit alpha n=1 Tax=Polycladospora coralii TaxID=2771432 RepID=UPI00174704DF|nr:ribonucleoside-diphosphate reductase subunit alpha [Polycladospora coralii]MBS7529024.1 ribonucleoside-diphosphate reductase subunit alpha [Polycladospora coralii]